jgi:hypothetical protein
MQNVPRFQVVTRQRRHFVNHVGGEDGIEIVAFVIAVLELGIDRIVGITTVGLREFVR